MDVDGGMGCTRASVPPGRLGRTGCSGWEFQRSERATNITKQPPRKKMMYEKKNYEGDTLGFIYSRVEGFISSRFGCNVEMGEWWSRF